MSQKDMEDVKTTKKSLPHHGEGNTDAKFD